MLQQLLSTLINLFARMAPWLLLGFLLAGILAIYIPRALVLRMMGEHTGLHGILHAVLIGVPLPICSCGVIPLAAALRQHGASKGAIAAFLISTPQTGIDSILATYALMGPLFAIARPIAAFLTGLAGGCVVHFLSQQEPVTVSTNTPPASTNTPPASTKATPPALLNIFSEGYVRLLGTVVKPLLLGLLIATAVTYLVPEDFFAVTLKDHDSLAMPLMALVGFPMYICSTAAIPIAASLMLKGISPGAAFVFLMVGPAINALSITTVSPMIGRRAAAAYVAIIALGAILCGIGINALATLLPPHLVQLPHPSNPSLSLLQQASAILLAALMTHAWIASSSPQKSCCA